VRKWTPIYGASVAIKGGCGGFLGGFKCILYELFLIASIYSSHNQCVWYSKESSRFIAFQILWPLVIFWEWAGDSERAYPRTRISPPTLESLLVTACGRRCEILILWVLFKMCSVYFRIEKMIPLQRACKMLSNDTKFFFFFCVGVY